MKKYETLFATIAESYAKRSGIGPNDLTRKFHAESIESMFREGICQILAAESFGVRWKILCSHPGLIIPYLVRVRK